MVPGGSWGYWIKEQTFFTEVNTCWMDPPGKLGSPARVHIPQLCMWAAGRHVSHWADVGVLTSEIYQLVVAESSRIWLKQHENTYHWNRQSVYDMIQSIGFTMKFSVSFLGIFGCPFFRQVPRNTNERFSSKPRLISGWSVSNFATVLLVWRWGTTTYHQIYRQHVTERTWQSFHKNYSIVIIPDHPRYRTCIWNTQPNKRIQIKLLGALSEGYICRTVKHILYLDAIHQSSPFLSTCSLHPHPRHHP